MKEFLETIAIDSVGTKVYEQTYSYNETENCIWIHLVSLVDRFDQKTGIKLNWSELIKFTKEQYEEIKIKKINIPFEKTENAKTETCISVNIKCKNENSNETYDSYLSDSQICCSKVQLKEKYTFEQVDKFLYEKDQNHWTRRFFNTAKSLKEKRTSSNKF